MLELMLPFALIALIPAAIAAARRKWIFALQLAFVGSMISIIPWIWVLLFPNTVGMGIAYVLTPLTMLGAPIFAVLALPFALFYIPRRAPRIL